MPVGIQVWNADGSYQFGPETPIGRILGSVATGTTNGSVSVQGFADGIPFAITAPIDATGTYFPDVSISGTTLSWTFPSGGQTASIIHYGVY